MSGYSICLKSYGLDKNIVILCNYFWCDAVILDDRGSTFLQQTTIKYFHGKKY